jgi:hypothetical protein
MQTKLGIATILSFACTIATAGNGNIGFTGRIVQPTAHLADASMAIDREISPLVASVRVGSLMTGDHTAYPLLDYFVGYLLAGPPGFSASLVEITYN